MNRRSALLLVALLWWCAPAPGRPALFPDDRPENGNFNRPAEGQPCDVSPPGFCWWRAGPRDRVFYRLVVQDEAGRAVHTSPRLRDPVYVPPAVLPAGDYSWVVSAVDDTDKTLAEREASRFTVEPDAIPLPWVEPAALLARVPGDHPRLLFPRADLETIRGTLATSRKEAFGDLKSLADAALDLPLMVKPTFDRFDREQEYPARRTAYRAAYQEFTQTYHQGVVPLALVYLLTGDERYGLAAKRHVLSLLDWETDGIASLEEGFDEIGLRIARVLPQCYDWLYGILTEEERQQVRAALVEHGNQMMERLERKDFLQFSAYSHDGRLPGYLVEFGIVLAEDPAAEAWMDYGLRALMTVFPHWAGRDGGWAEGINYAISYNDRFITPLASLEMATGQDLWQMPYFRKMRRFLTTCAVPRGEIMPFGDGEHGSVSGMADQLRSILGFHALKFRDPGVKWWTTLLDTEDLGSSRMGSLHRLILPDDLEPVPPSNWAPDQAFFGVGWAALHSDLTRPDQDLMVLFKSSPFAAISHSHADQNSFAILKGGQALALPSGQRYPQHFSPFHTEYTWQTVAHNALLFGGRGQTVRDEGAGGKLIGFRSQGPMGYVCGDASACYGDLVDRYYRHVVMIRPSVVLVVDDVDLRRTNSVAWLMHGIERFEVDEGSQALVSARGEERMTVYLAAPGGFDFSQTDAWPVPPRKDYPMVTAPEPEPQWHFTARLREDVDRVRIAAVMMVHKQGEQPACNLTAGANGEVRLRIPRDGGMLSIDLALRPSGEPSSPLGTVDDSPASGHGTTLRLMPEPASPF